MICFRYISVNALHVGDDDDDDDDDDKLLKTGEDKLDNTEVTCATTKLNKTGNVRLR